MEQKELIKKAVLRWRDKYSTPGDFEESGQQEAMYAGIAIGQSLQAIPKDSVGTQHAVRIGGYLLIEKDCAGHPWMYGPDGDGMSMSPPTMKKLEEVIAKFFKEHM